ncbi:hypothetical protein LLG95_06985 [bacterium]|nr:hypothetical protein [bacterium]
MPSQAFEPFTEQQALPSALVLESAAQQAIALAPALALQPAQSAHFPPTAHLQSANEQQAVALASALAFEPIIAQPAIVVQPVMFLQSAQPSLHVQSALEQAVALQSALHLQSAVAQPAAAMTIVIRNNIQTFFIIVLLNLLRSAGLRADLILSCTERPQSNFYLPSDRSRRWHDREIHGKGRASSPVQGAAWKILWPDTEHAIS